MTTPDPDVVERALAALRGDQETFTRAQVGFLMDLAFRAGLGEPVAEQLADVIDLGPRFGEQAEMHAVWRTHPFVPATYEQRVSARLAEMDDQARRAAEARGEPYRAYPGGPAQWETDQGAAHAA